MQKGAEYLIVENMYYRKEEIMTNFKEFLNEFITKTKEEIKELAKTELENKEKKTSLDEKIIGFVQAALNSAKLNFFAKFVLKKFVLPYICEFTQIIYDLLKTKINGITTKKGEI